MLVKPIFCSVCAHDFPVAFGVQDACRRHIDLKKHKTLCNEIRKKAASSFFVKNNKTSVVNAKLFIHFPECTQYSIICF